MKLKLRLPSGAEIVSLTDKADAELNVEDLLGQLNKEGRSVREIRVGYPPKAVEFGTESDRKATLHSVGIRNGEQLVVNLNPTTSTTAPNPPAKLEQTGPGSARPPEATPQNPDQLTIKVRNGGYLRLRVMEDDNSCMFRAVGYAFMKSLDSMFELRQVVAETIRNNPVDYNDAILGRKSEEYIDWILRENSWGGAIELDILSKHFDVTICSLDVGTGRIDHFNPGKDQFIIVIYSGIHYDTVALNALEDDDGSGEFDTTVFRGDELGAAVLDSLALLGNELKRIHYYTDTAGFSLRCKICRTVVKGEKGATKHAEVTGHIDFGEV